MNNTTTKRNLTAMFAVLMVATLVVGAFAATATTQSTQQSAFAYPQTKKGDKGNGNDNGNTITIQKCKQAATQSGWDNNQGQECENLICTHPGENATCTQEGVRSAAAEAAEPTTTTLLVKKVCVLPNTKPCPSSTKFTITVTDDNPQPSTFVLANGDSQLVTFSGPSTYTISEETPSDHAFTTGFSGDCTERSEDGIPTATGTISAGEHQTCTIRNAEEM
jgi:hypothetical protein